MTPLFRKLNLKDRTSLVVLNAPASFEPELAALTGVNVQRMLRRGTTVSFALAFATTQRQLDDASTLLIRAAAGDAVLWIGYPKATSKAYACEFNRDSGWSVLGAAGYEPVRQVAVDADWSALRFRKAEFIRSMTRDPAGAISKSGRAKTSGKRSGRRVNPHGEMFAVTR